MFALLIHPDHQLPVILSQNDRNYPDFIMSGYEVISTGHKKDLQDEAEEMLQEIYS